MSLSLIRVPGIFYGSKGGRSLGSVHALKRLCYLYIFSTLIKDVPLAERSKACVCSRSLACIVILNPTGGMDVCC
jgi:hypothetical protein